MARKQQSPQADGAAGIRAVLTSSRLAAPTAAKMESTFITRLESDLGGPGKAAVAYRMWLDLNASPRPLSVEELTQSVRWESTLSKATWHALAGWPEAGDQAFFILHLK